jgi:hypothetical protein
MNKVIAVFDDRKISESTLDYAIYLAKNFNAHIAATFINDITSHSTAAGGENGYIVTDRRAINTIVKRKDQVGVTFNKRLQTTFDAKGVRYNINANKSFALESLINESYYADMIVIDGNEQFIHLDFSKPGRFLKHVLSGARCPVMVVQAGFKPIEKFVFAYDGTPSSVYAIKQFSYLFPSIREQEVEILSIKDDKHKHTNNFPDQHFVKELLNRKYTSVIESVIINNNADEAFVDRMQAEKKNCMLVLGAYERSTFSRWLYQSIADTLISKLDIPLFIAHK